MGEGTVVAAGTFDEVVSAVPAFAEQAALAGLAGAGALDGRTPGAEEGPR